MTEIGQRVFESCERKEKVGRLGTYTLVLLQAFLVTTAWGVLRGLVTLESTPAEFAGQELEATRSFAVLAVNGYTADVAVLEAD